VPLTKCYMDVESVGFYGLPVLLQYAIGAKGGIHLFEPWRRPARESVELIEKLMKYCFVGFNASFDMFHLCKLYTIWRLLPPDMIPAKNVALVAQLEPEGRNGPCVKPASCLDLMLHSRKGPYQSLMRRNDVRINKVPTILAGALAQELENRVELDGILFAKRSDPDAPKWQVFDRKNRKGELDPDFKDVVLKFRAAGGLKFLVEYALGLTPEFRSFTEVELSKELRPWELGYVPFALGVSSPEKNWEVFDKTGKSVGFAWPAVIEKHIQHWAENQEARRYAAADVEYTRMLDKHFMYPEIGDDDSLLACMVAAVRWHGFTVDLEQTKGLLAKARQTVEQSPVNINKPEQVRRYVRECMDETEALLIDDSTKKSNLEQIRDEMVVEEEGEICIKCLGEGCARCRNKGILGLGRMPAAERADEILNIKFAAKEVELHSKLMQAGRFHASFNVIGTLSSRMSGGDGLNAQGIKHSSEVRRMFPLSWSGMVLCGGDFDSFEVTLADAVFHDPILRADLLGGKKLHALMGMALYPGKTYEDILASNGAEFDMYTRGKQAVFAMLYGGDHNTIHNKLAIPLVTAEEAFVRFQKRYPGIKASREEVFERFQALKQPGGIGTVIDWKDPDDFSETFLGFKRFFTLENGICKALFKLAQHPPKHWRRIKLEIVRRDRVQQVGGAVSSALYGAAFQLQAGNTRAANNHLIQSPGAQITKAVQRRIWDIQPAGVSDWRVAPMNIHDEVMCVTHPDYVDEVAEVVTEAVESFRPQVPLIGMKWAKKMDNWSEKGAGSEIVHIKPPEEVSKDGSTTHLADGLDDTTVEGPGLPESDCDLEQIAQDDADIEAIRAQWGV